MFENPRRGRQARNFTTNVLKILDLKSSSEQIFFRKLLLGAPDLTRRVCTIYYRYSTVRNNSSFVYRLPNCAQISYRVTTMTVLHVTNSSSVCVSTVLHETKLSFFYRVATVNKLHASNSLRRYYGHHCM